VWRVTSHLNLIPRGKSAATPPPHRGSFAFRVVQLTYSAGPLESLCDLI
jgi:hypothetical protein